MILDDVKTRVNSLNLGDSKEEHTAAVANHFGYKLSVKEKDLKFCYAGGGIGGIIRNKDGEIIHFFSKITDGEEIFALEIQAICEGVAVAKNLGITSLWIEADSSFAVNSFNKISSPPWKKIPAIHRAWSELAGMTWRISHIWREGNMAADFLSKRECPFKGHSTFQTRVPDDLLAVVKSDREKTMLFFLFSICHYVDSLLGVCSPLAGYLAPLMFVSLAIAMHAFVYRFLRCDELGLDVICGGRHKKPLRITAWNIPRYRITAWKAVQNKLPTKDRLPFLDSNADLNCVLCNRERETVNHLFFRCGYSSWIWSSILWRACSKRKASKSLFEEEEWIRSHFTGDGQAATGIRLCFSYAIHKIWIERNKRIFDKISRPKELLLRDILAEIKRKMGDIDTTDIETDKNLQIAANLGYKLRQNQGTLKECRWIPPDQGMLKINTDASLDDEGGGLGGILRDNVGSVLGMFSVNVPTDTIGNLEILAIKRGIDLASNHPSHSLWIESDSMLAVECINGRTKHPWKLHEDMEAIRHQLALFHAWKITHLWREGNMAADFLSKRDCICKGDYIHPSLSPPILLDIINLDKGGRKYIRM
ncbi:uncharacterized protein LOC143878956 [Tasmannia lanceolata]|uniref:uncharacterized protein LOC143878956 n=1 Tax=Tasmannia lanceolata TaxID=3420 RepID=UPI0040633AE3